MSFTIVGISKNCPWASLGIVGGLQGSAGVSGCLWTSVGVRWHPWAHFSITRLTLLSAQRLKTTKKLNETEKVTMAANDTNEFKIIKFIQIQKISKVKRYRFVLKCYQDCHKISKKSASYVDLYIRNTSFLK